jgi:UMF1 family MFS transporter
MRTRIDRPAAAWAFYDWANSAFSTTVMAGFFPLLFKQYWCAGMDAAESSYRLGVANSISSLAIALVAPTLGAIADAGGARKRFLLASATIGVVATAMLFFVRGGDWAQAAVLYVIAAIGFSASMIFYDSMLLDVSTPETSDYVSSYGFALGYLGGGLLFVVNILMYRMPGAFGLSDGTAAARWSFVTVAAWWAVFSIPLARVVRERVAVGARGWPPAGAHKAGGLVRSADDPPQRAVGGQDPRADADTVAPGRRDPRALRDGFRAVEDTFRHLRRHRPAFLFLLGYWFYIDGVHTIVRMGMDYGLSLGFSAGSLITALLMIQFVGFPATIAFGKTAERFGARAGIMAAIVIYILICAWGYRIRSAWEFFVLAGGIGLAQGGINSLSRSFYSRLIPADESAQFFGYYNTIGRFSAVLGPWLMGSVSLATGNPRLSMLALTLFFVVGGAFLLRVPGRAAEGAS